MNQFENHFANQFENHLYSKFVETIQSIPADVTKDIYVFGVQIEFIADDYRKGEAGICFNTESNYQNSPQAQDPESSRWDWSHWFLAPDMLNNCGPQDPYGAALRDEYFETQGLSISDEELQ